MSAIEPAIGNDRIIAPTHLLDPKGGEHFVLRVVGNSMEDEAILDGDYMVIVRRDPLPGELAVVLVGDDAFIKRWHPDGDFVRLVSVIEGRPEVRVRAGEAKAQGVAVGMMRKWR